MFRISIFGFRILSIIYMPQEKTELYDLVIIGAAAVGTAAAVYAARRRLKFVVVAKDIGGEVALSGVVDNWPGVVHTTGIELANQFQNTCNHTKCRLITILKSWH